jgi:hypothetical protein
MEQPKLRMRSSDTRLTTVSRDHPADRGGSSTIGGNLGSSGSKIGGDESPTPAITGAGTLLTPYMYRSKCQLE